MRQGADRGRRVSERVKKRGEREDGKREGERRERKKGKDGEERERETYVPALIA